MFGWLGRKSRDLREADEFIRYLSGVTNGAELHILKDAIARRQRYVAHYFGSLSGYELATKDRQNNLLRIFMQDLAELETAPRAYYAGTRAMWILLRLIQDKEVEVADRLTKAVARIVIEDGFLEQ
jgi:hypothetical protein